MFKKNSQNYMSKEIIIFKELIKSLYSLLLLNYHADHYPFAFKYYSIRLIIQIL